MTPAYLSYSFESRQEAETTINEELQKVSEWLVTNRLSLNVDKSNYIIFSLKNKRDKLSITMNNEHIQEKESTKYLGVILDRKMNWIFNINIYVVQCVKHALLNIIPFTHLPYPTLTLILHIQNCKC